MILFENNNTLNVLVWNYHIFKREKSNHNLDLRCFIQNPILIILADEIHQ